MSVYRRFDTENLPSFVMTDIARRRPVFRSARACELLIDTLWFLVPFFLVPGSFFLVPGGARRGGRCRFPLCVISGLPYYRPDSPRKKARMISPSPSTRHSPPSGRGHGGKRPGAGAPKGNLNGFKHGKYSPRYRGLINALAESPDVAAIMRALAEAFSQRESLRAANTGPRPERLAGSRAANRTNQENRPQSNLGSDFDFFRTSNQRSRTAIEDIDAGP